MGARGWGVILQLLKEQSDKLEKLGTTLKCIQEGILKNNPQPVKMSVGEKFQKELVSHPITRKMAVLQRWRSASGGYPEMAQKGGEECSTLSSRGTQIQKGKGQYVAFISNGHQELAP